MASDQDYTPEDQKQIAEILASIAPETSSSHTSPMSQQYQTDLAEISQSPEAAIPEPAAPEADMEDLSELTTPEAAIPEPAAPEADMGDLSELTTPEAAIPEPAAPEADMGNLSELTTPEAAIPEPGTPEADMGDLSELITPEAAIPEPAAPEADMGDLSELITPEAAIPEPGTPEADMGDLSELITPEAAIPEPGTPEADMGDLSELITPEAAIPEPGTPEADMGALSELITPEAAIPEPGTPEADMGDLSELTISEPIQTTEQPDFGLPDSFNLDTPSASGTSELDLDTPVPLEDYDSLDLDQPSALGEEISGELSSSDVNKIDQQAQLSGGIEGEFTDKELAHIRTALLEYPPQLRKSVIDIVVNEKISPAEQRLLMNMLIGRAEAKKIADFIETHLGYRPDIKPIQYTKDGLEVIYADELSPQTIARRRRRSRIILASTALGLIGLIGVFAALSLYRQFFVQDLYAMGLAELVKARHTFSIAERNRHKEKAENYFQQALRKDGNRYDSDYLNRYGIAYMKARFYEEAFTKLFGRSDPSYEAYPQERWSSPRRRVPLIRRMAGSIWQRPLGKGTRFTDQLDRPRQLVTAGAYMVDRLREGSLRRQTLINLARFHSNIARDSLRGESRKYKNDTLAIDYYRQILTLMNKPNDIAALAGIGDIYYNQQKLTRAANQYLKIIDRFPLDITGNTRLLNTYIALARRTQDPRLALAKHRELRRLGLEEDFPIYLMVRLAGLYIQLDADDVLIKYQIDPVDSMSGLDLRENARHLLDLAFKKEELRDDEKIIGSRYGEGFYQRGLFLLKEGKSLRALKHFQNAHNYDPLHYLAVNAIGEYYKNTRDFERSSRYFPKAIEIYKQFIQYAGSRPEDESLLAGDVAKIYYNAGSLLFLRYAGFNDQSSLGFPDTRLYPFRAQKADTPDITKRRQRLAQAKEYFDLALKYNLQDQRYLSHLRYWSGWIDYMNGNSQNALNQWEAMEPEHQNRDLVLILGKANSYYYTDQLRNALGHYLKVRSNLETEAPVIKARYNSGLKAQQRQMLLAATYNNIGAVYESEAQNSELPRSSEQFRGLEKEALLYYWKSVETARKAGLENEIARTNVQLSFQSVRQDQARRPLLDDWLPPALPSLKDKL